MIRLQRMKIGFAVFLCVCGLFVSIRAGAWDETVLKGKVADVAGKACGDVRVFVYDSPDVRRPAEFISSPTGNDGLYRISLRPGRYWVVARLKKADGYGPLMPGDKHSGEPKEIEIASGAEESVDFTVADLRDAIKIREKTKEGPLRITGRIVDGNGSPVAGAYVFADGNADIASRIPDYLSAWTGEDGRYTLYVPRGKYFVAVSSSFPPRRDYFIKEEMTFDADMSDIDVVRKLRDSK